MDESAVPLHGILLPQPARGSLGSPPRERRSGTISTFGKSPRRTSGAASRGFPPIPGLVPLLEEVAGVDLLRGEGAPIRNAFRSRRSAANSFCTLLTKILGTAFAARRSGEDPVGEIVVRIAQRRHGSFPAKIISMQPDLAGR